ncbi:MAG TPA: hypothetical protein VN701_00310 [Candidatus Paceibacterota bacterium]|nr:hypothetical protein [Candidatus Paceibacterota bacterium]
MTRALGKAVQRELQAIVDQKAEALTPERQTLLEIIGSDDQLAYWQRESAKHYLIRLGPVYRDRATVRFKAYHELAYSEIYYSLTTDERGHCELVIKPMFDSTRLEVKFPWVWAFCRHKAAEAMLGVRDLHAAYREKLARKRARDELQKADAI